MRLGISKRRRKFNIAIVFAFAAAAALLFWGAARFQNAFVNAARAYANGEATTAVSRAVYETFAEYGEYEFSSVNTGGDIVMFDTDTAKVNMVNSTLVDNLQRYIALEEYTTMYIPLGALTGIDAISGAGPRVPVKIHPVNIINTDIDETFDSGGINQVRHSMSVAVEIVMSYSGYMFSTEEIIAVTVPVTDTVIIGDTPLYYGSGNVSVAGDNAGESAK